MHNHQQSHLKQHHCSLVAQKVKPLRWIEVIWKDYEVVDEEHKLRIQYKLKKY